jgi:hypothetical protein
MKPAINDASARQRAGGPPPVPGRVGDREKRPRSADIIEVERQIAELVDRSTQDLRVAWRELHGTGPPSGSQSRDRCLSLPPVATLTRTSATHAIIGVKRLSTQARDFRRVISGAPPT